VVFYLKSFGDKVKSMASMQVVCVAIRRRVTYDYEIIGWKLYDKEHAELARGPFLNPLKEKLQSTMGDIKIEFTEGMWEEG